MGHLRGWSAPHAVVDIVLSSKCRLPYSGTISSDCLAIDKDDLHVIYASNAMNRYCTPYHGVRLSWKSSFREAPIPRD